MSILSVGLVLSTSISLPLVTQVTLQGTYSGWIPFFIVFLCMGCICHKSADSSKNNVKNILMYLVIALESKKTIWRQNLKTISKNLAPESARQKSRAKIQKTRI